MLQWMGGSRRKVTTSRKSIQKRQKQYFEQRRRQQQQHQQIAGLEGSEGEGKKGEKNHNEHQSLDILNLLNFSTSSHEGKPAFPSYPPVLWVSTVTTAASLETNHASSPSDCPVETLSPKKFLFDCPDNHNNAFNESNDKQDRWKTETQQQLSIYDLLGDDETNGNLEGSPTQEAHVAFSVNGLGKVGTETPPGSPQKFDRFNSYGCFSPRKAARQLNSSRNHSYVLNGLEHEVDAIMQDVEMPLTGISLNFSTGVKDSYKKLKKNLSFGGDYKQLDGQERKLRSSFVDGKAFCNTGINYEDLWDARSGSVYVDFLDEKQCDSAWKSWPCHPEDVSSDFLKFGNNEMPNYAFESVNLLQKRDASKATERFNYLDSFSPKHQTSDHGYDFITPEGSSGRHHLVGTNFDFGDVTGHPDLSGFSLEDAREGLSSLSEESCSSTAVREEMSDISPEYSGAREKKRYGHAFGGPEIEHGAKDILAKEKHFKRREDLQKGNNECRSGKWTQMPTLPDSKSACNLNFVSKEKIGPHGSWLFEQGYRSADTNLGLSSACPALERKHPSTGSKPFSEEFFGDAKFSFSRFKEGSFFKPLPSGNCIFEKFTSCQPPSRKHCYDSPSMSNWATKPDFSPNSPDFELERRPANSSQDAFSHGDNLFADMSAQGSVIRSDQNQSESQQVKDEQIKPQKEILTEMNMRGIEAFDSEEQGPKCKDSKEEAVETSSAFSDKSKSSLYGTERHHDDEVPLLCEQGNEGNEEPKESKISSKRDSNCLNSSPQLMMLESYVQLLCVQKVATKATR